MRVIGFSAVKPSDELKNPPKYDIIKADNSNTYMRIYNADGKEKYRYLQTDAIQKLDSSEAIAQYFAYTDKYGDAYKPITSAFGNFKLDVQKEAAEGIDWARKTYRLDKLPLQITRNKTKKNAYGTYDSVTRTLTLRPSLKVDEAYVTSVHEMTHFAIHVLKVDTDTLFEQALKNIGLKKRTKQADNLQHMSMAA